MNAREAIPEIPSGGASMGEYYVDDLYGVPNTDPPAPSRVTTVPCPPPRQPTPPTPPARRGSPLSPLAASSIGALLAMVLVLGVATTTLVGVVVYLMLSA